MCIMNACQTVPYSLELYTTVCDLTPLICNLTASLICSLTYTTIGYILILSIERFIAICRPLRYVQWYQKSYLIIWGIAPFLVGVPLGVVPLMGWGRYAKSRNETSYCGLDVTSSPENGKSYFLFSMFLVLVLPCVLTTTCYVCIIRDLRMKVNKVMSVYGRRSTMLLETSKDVRQQYISCFLTGLVYGLSWVPYTVFLLLSMRGQLVPVQVEYFAIYMSKSATITSPVVYCLLERQCWNFLAKQFSERLSIKVLPQIKPLPVDV